MRKGSYALLAVFVLVYAVVAIRDFALHMNVSDDVLWYYYIGSGVLEPSAFRAEHEILPQLKTLAENERAWQRVELRAGYAGNYVLPTLVCFYVGNFLAGVSGTAMHFTEYLSAALFSGYLAALAFVFIVGVAAFCASSVEMQRVSVGAIALLAAFGLLPIDGSIAVLSSPPTGFRDLAAIPYRLAKILVDPHHAIAPFGAMARNQIIFLTVGVFALRWSGKPALSYAFLIVLLLVHQSMAFLLFAAVLAVDVVMRPALFRNYRLLGVVAAGLCVALVREAHWAGLGRAALAIAAGTCVLAAVLFGLLAFAKNRGVLLMRARRRLERVRQRWEGEVVGDVIGLTFVFAAAMAAAVVGNELANAYSRDYFWSSLPGRFFAVLRPMYFMAIAYFLLRHFSGRMPFGVSRSTMARLGLVSIALLLGAQLALTPPLSEARARVLGGIRAIDETLDRSSSVYKITDESRLYYALIKSRVTQEDYLRAMWPAR